jgi:hypothetical protein
MLFDGNFYWLSRHAARIAPVPASHQIPSRVERSNICEPSFAWGAGVRFSRAVEKEALGFPRELPTKPYSSMFRGFFGEAAANSSLKWRGGVSKEACHW